MTKEEFIKKAREIHGWKYDYSMVQFKSNKDKVAIICPEHGVFYKTIEKHLYAKQGCPECIGKKRYTNEEFLRKIETLPNIEELSFEDVHYANNKTKIKIYCYHKDENGNEHGEFEISPGHFLAGERCPKCRYIKSSSKKRRNLEEVKKIASEIHNGKYDYSLITEYKNDRIKYPIICPEHGVFYQAFNNHIKAKQGCPICGREKCDRERVLPFEEFENRANAVHNEKYTYIPESYSSISNKLRIICPIHGEFEQLGTNHVDLRQGCPKCGVVEFKGEYEIYQYLCNLIGEDKVQRRCKGILDGNYELDIYVPSENFAIEYNGLYWHSEIAKDKNYHLRKTDECNSKGIRLFHIFEDEWLEKSEIIKSMLSNIFGKTEHKIYARKCEIKEISTNDAKSFLNENHLQGYCVSKYRLGLFFNNELISVMTFGKSRHFVGHNEDKMELLRFANKININVIGGASKLFSYFIKKYNPKEIVSYADKRWSEGHLYDVLGFMKYNESKPNYYYIVGRKRIYRFNLRKSILVEKYGCPKDMSEREFCLKQKWYRIYDCGCLCYIWRNDYD